MKRISRWYTKPRPN